MNTKEVSIQRGLLERLTNRQLFLWPKAEQETIAQALKAKAQSEARQKIATLNQTSTLSPQTAIESVRPRAKSWQFGELLDHILPG